MWNSHLPGSSIVLFLKLLSFHACKFMLHNAETFVLDVGTYHYKKFRSSWFQMILVTTEEPFSPPPFFFGICNCKVAYMWRNIYSFMILHWEILSNNLLYHLHSFYSCKKYGFPFRDHNNCCSFSCSFLLSLPAILGEFLWLFN